MPGLAPKHNVKDVFLLTLPLLRLSTLRTANDTVLGMIFVILGAVATTCRQIAPIAGELLILILSLFARETMATENAKLLESQLMMKYFRAEERSTPYAHRG